MKFGKILSILLTVMIAFSAISPALADGEIKVTLDGEELSFDVKPQLINDRTMVPMRKIFEAMGAQVEWDDDNQTVTATRNNIVVKMQIGNSVINVGGTEVTLDVPPQLIDDRTLVPVRAVAESFLSKVDWNNDSSTVIITSQNSSDVNVTTDFICNVNPTLAYGLDDMWRYTDAVPFVKTINSAYRNQVIMISPFYANYAVDDKGNAKVTLSVKNIKPDGSEKVLGENLTAFEGAANEGEIIKSTISLEYMIEDGDPLGEYTFVIDSKDEIADKTYESVFKVNFTDYKYEKNEFKSDDEFTDFLYNYSVYPEPERIIDAVIYAEKNYMLTNSVTYGALQELLAKNSYLADAAKVEFEKEFGKDGTETLQLLISGVANYVNLLKSADIPTVTNISLPSDINGNIFFYGATIGVYFVTGSYDAAVLLASSLGKYEFAEEYMAEQDVPDIKELIQYDELFNAYCNFMIQYDDSLDKRTKEKIAALIK